MIEHKIAQIVRLCLCVAEGGGVKLTMAQDKYKQP
jgi:hypothetical protein